MSDISQGSRDETRKYISEVSKLAVPSFLATFIIYSMETFNLIFVSKVEIASSELSNMDLIEGIGTGNIFMNFFGFLFGLGMINALETLCSQEFGRLDFKQLSKWAKLCFYFMTLYFLLVAIISLNSEYIILNVLRQNQKISYIAACYIYSLIPSFLVQFYLNIFTKILNSQQIYTSVLCINLCILLLHPLWCYIFFSLLGFYYYGLGIAYSITSLLILIALMIYTKYYNLYQQVNFSEITKRDYCDFLKVSIQSGVLCSTDILGFEIVSIISSFLPDEQRTANITIINIYNNVYSISIGFATALTTLVGNYIGKEKIKEAEKAAKIGSLVNFTLTVFISLFCILFHDTIAGFYLKEKTVLRITSKLIRLVGIFIIFDALQLQLNGIIRGIGKLFQGMIIGLIIFILLQSFLTYLFTYPLKFGVYGIWIGCLISTSLGSLVYFIYMIYAFRNLRKDFLVKIGCSPKDKLDNLASGSFDNKNEGIIFENKNHDQRNTTHISNSNNNSNNVSNSNAKAIDYRNTHSLDIITDIQNFETNERKYSNSSINKTINHSFCDV